MSAVTPVFPAAPADDWHAPGCPCARCTDELLERLRRPIVLPAPADTLASALTPAPRHGQARMPHRRQARYVAAVRRQIALVECNPVRYAPVESFLRRGDAVEMFLDGEQGGDRC